jgi:hypothetical protein
MKSSTGVNP